MAGSRQVLTYISGPLTNGGAKVDKETLDYNIGRGCEVAYELNKRGHAFVLPHLTMFFQHIHGSDLPFEDWIAIDLRVIESCDCLYRIKGESKGADIEEAHARSLGIPVFYDLRALDEWANAPIPLDQTQEIPVVREETVLEEAARITTADRNVQYGPPEEHMARTAQFWSALFGQLVMPSTVAKAMVLDKVSRSMHAPKRDHAVDAAGWAAVWHRAETGEW